MYVIFWYVLLGSWWMSDSCVEENVKTVIVEEPLNRSKKVDGTTRNKDHTATVRWSDIVKNDGPGSIGDQMSSKEKGKSS